MEEYRPETYGESFADVYDEWYADLGDHPAAIDRLAQLAGDPTRAGPLLELGAGTGRLAIPLASLGYEVWGLDASPAMLDRLRSKPGGDRVRIVTADMADVGHLDEAVWGESATPSFRLVVAAFNTFLNLASEAAQAGCLAGVARRLRPQGRLVIEAFVPAESHRASAGVVEVGRIDIDRVVLTISRARSDDEQVVDGQHVELREAGTRLRPWRIRYVTPDQLDRMAAEAGLSLIDRWSGWAGQPFGDDSAAHVSVYGVRPGHEARR